MGRGEAGRDGGPGVWVFLELAVLHRVPQPCRCLGETSRLLLMLVVVSGEVPVLSSPTSGLPATWARTGWRQQNDISVQGELQAGP